MPSSYHAFKAKAKSALFLLSLGLPGLAEPLAPELNPESPRAAPLGTSQAEPLDAAAVAKIPAMGPELAARAPFLPLAWDVLHLHGEERRPMRGGDILICGECASSLDVAMRLAQADLLPEWGSVLAVAQNSGRGQLRRSWVSPPGNIYAALRLPAQGFFSSWNAALAVGWMLAQSLREAGFPVCIKWPNDLLLSRNGGWGKIGGILLEERGGILLAGVGLNISFAPGLDTARRERAVEAATLIDAGCDLPMVSLWMDLVKRGQFLYADWLAQKEGKLDLRSVEALLAWNNCMVRVCEADAEEYRGVVKGLDVDGRLRLATQSGEIFLTSGTIRLAE